ncbi:hypothetical protein MD484_g5018, partial [Candolleomyces efflorescens]
MSSHPESTFAPRRLFPGLPTFSVIRRKLTYAVGGSSNDRSIPSQGACESRRRLLYQNAIPVVWVMFSIAETIPLFGTSLRGAMEALYKILILVEQRFEASDAIQDLGRKLANLTDHLSKRPPSDQLASLFLELNKTESALSSLLKKKGICYGSILKEINSLSSFVDSCLLTYTSLVVTEMHQTFVEVSTNVNSLRREVALVDVITVIDPFGNPQTIFRVDAMSRAAVAGRILQRYSFNPQLQSILEGFVADEHYEFKLEAPQTIFLLEDGDLGYIERGAKVVMSVILYRTRSRHDSERCCPICHTPMHGPGVFSSYRTTW